MIVSATGHRPDAQEDPSKILNAKRGLNFFLKAEPKIDYIISGMAAGWDTTIARAALHYKIPLHCYVPYRGQKATSEFYEQILQQAENIVYCSDKYFDGVFLERDRQMVDASNLVLAFWNPDVKKGGTFYTVKYARKNGVPVINFY